MSSSYLETINYKIAQATRLKRKLVDQAVESLDLTRAQWQTLAWMNNLGMPCPQKLLLQYTEFDAAQLTRVLDQLEKRRIIKRISSKTDRRSIDIDITKSGLNLLTKVADIINNEEQLMQHGFNATEKKNINKLLDKIILNLANEIK